MHDTVSIVVPVYNAEKYLVRCLDSIIGQTKKELEEAKKENLFLKKAAAFFAKEID